MRRDPVQKAEPTQYFKAVAGKFTEERVFAFPLAELVAPPTVRHQSETSAAVSANLGLPHYTLAQQFQAVSSRQKPVGHVPARKPCFPAPASMDAAFVSAKTCGPRAAANRSAGGAFHRGLSLEASAVVKMPSRALHEQAPVLYDDRRNISGCNRTIALQCLASRDPLSGRDTTHRRIAGVAFCRSPEQTSCTTSQYSKSDRVHKRWPAILCDGLANNGAISPRGTSCALFFLEHSDVLNRGLYRAPLPAPQADDQNLIKVKSALLDADVLDLPAPDNRG